MIDFWLERDTKWRASISLQRAREGSGRERKGDAVVELSSWSEALGHRAL